MGRVDDAMRRATEERERGQQTDQAEPTAVLEADETAHRHELSRRARASALAAARPPEARARCVASTGGADRPRRVVDAAPEEPPAPLMETVDRRLTGKLVADESMPPGCREQYRRLAAVLHHSQAASGMKVVMIASAVAGEGKTLTATNLALTFSESYRRRVLLIDGDLRRPSVHVVFGIQSVPGLSDGLAAVEPRKLPLHQVSERLAILPAGRPTSDPMAGLTSERMRKLIDEAQAGIRLGDHRHAAGRPDDRRQPARDHDGWRDPRREGGLDAVSMSSARHRGDREGPASSARCSTGRHEPP